MPGASKVQRAEAKYNVVLDCESIIAFQSSSGIDPVSQTRTLACILLPSPETWGSSNMPSPRDNQ